jgi:hypothetical protein
MIVDEIVCAVSRLVCLPEELCLYLIAYSDNCGNCVNFSSLM